MKTEGDAFMAAFAASLDAVRCAAELQVALHDAPWPQWLVGKPPAAAPKRSSFFGAKRAEPPGAMEPAVALLSREVWREGRERGNDDVQKG